MRDAPDRIWARPDYNECWLKKGEEEDELYHHDDKVKELEAQLEKVTAERDMWKASTLVARDASILFSAEADEAAIPRAYRMGLEAGAEYMFKEWDDEDAQLHREAIRAMPTPADLVKRVIKEAE